VTRIALRRLLAAPLLVSAAALGAVAWAVPAGAQSPGWATLGGLAFPSSDHATIWQLAADPAQPADILAATSRGVYRSSDGGQLWTATSIARWTWTVAFSGSGSASYAGTETGGVYRSTDAGASWSQDNGGLSNLDVRAVAIAPDAVVLGTNSGVYVGGTGIGWEPAGLKGTSISSLAVIAASPLGVLAGSDSTTASVNLFSNLAVGSATSWQSVTGGDPQGAPVFAIGAGPQAKGATSPPILVGNLKGLYLSTNGGSTFQEVNLSQGAVWSVNTIAFDPVNPDVVYVGGDNGGSTGGGLQRSVNGGSSWQVWQTGLPAADVTGIWVEPTNPVTALASLWVAATRQPLTAKLIDTTAPGPVPLQAIGATSPIQISPPPAASPTPSSTPTGGRGHGVSIAIPAWAPPVVAAILVVALVGIFMWLRRRRSRLDAEAPP